MCSGGLLGMGNGSGAAAIEPLVLRKTLLTIVCVSMTDAVLQVKTKGPLC